MEEDRGREEAKRKRNSKSRKERAKEKAEKARRLLKKKEVEVVFLPVLNPSCSDHAPYFIFCAHIGIISLQAYVRVQHSTIVSEP